MFPSTSPKSPLKPPTHTHSCCWDWCRLTFPTNALLVDHVIHKHVHTAQPVRRRDLPMLRRAEEGVGESLGFSVSAGSGEFESLFCSSIEEFQGRIAVYNCYTYIFDSLQINNRHSHQAITTVHPHILPALPNAHVLNYSPSLSLHLPHKPTLKPTPNPDLHPLLPAPTPQVGPQTRSHGAPRPLRPASILKLLMPCGLYHLDPSSGSEVLETLPLPEVKMTPVRVRVRAQDQFYLAKGKRER